MKKIVLIPLLLIFLPCIAQGQLFESVKETVDGKERNIYFVANFEVTPSLPSEPALRYKLTWGFDQRTATNAAVKYNYAMRELTQYRFWSLLTLAEKQQEDLDRILTDPEFFAEKKAARDAFEKELAALSEDSPRDADTRRNEARLGRQVSEYERYCSFPRDKFPMDKAKEFVRGFQGAYQYLEEGSRCDYCDWEHPIRGNDNPIAILLPEIHECRNFARALMIKARVEIYEGDYDAAIKTIRIGKIMAKHVASEPFLISVLVGIAVDGMMNATLGELMRQPDAPNLYWTLTAQPGLTGAMSKGIELEMDMLRSMVPGLIKAMETPDALTDAEWKELNDRLCKIAAEFVESMSSLSSLLTEDSFDNQGFAAMLRLLNVPSYPRAKQWLIDQGKTPEEVENMHTTKVIGLWSVERYKVIRDDMLKLASLPPSQRKPLLEEHDRKLVDSQRNFGRASPLDMMVCALFPAVGAAFGVETRTVATNDILRIVEAIRLYAAQHDGKLPEKLEDIVAVPIPPVDPYTGKPYDYKIIDGAAVIESGTGSQMQRFVVKLRSQETGVRSQ
jgi:hypothetical protein